MEIRKEASKFHREADAEIALMENIQEFCSKEFLASHSDQKIAEMVEAEFGIPATKILDQFQDRSIEGMFSSVELIMRAYYDVKGI